MKYEKTIIKMEYLSQNSSFIFYDKTNRIVVDMLSDNFTRTGSIQIIKNYLHLFSF